MLKSSFGGLGFNGWVPRVEIGHFREQLEFPAMLPIPELKIATSHIKRCCLVVVNFDGVQWNRKTKEGGEAELNVFEFLRGVGLLHHGSFFPLRGVRVPISGAPTSVGLLFLSVGGGWCGYFCLTNETKKIRPA